MLSGSVRLCLTLFTSYSFWAACAGSLSGEREFLGKRPGSTKDEQLWNAFLRSENQVDHGSSIFDQDLTPPTNLGSTQSGVFLDATVEDDTKHGMQAALDSCIKAHFSDYLKPGLPKPAAVPGGTLAAVAAAAAASLSAQSMYQQNLIKDQLKACLETTQNVRAKLVGKVPPHPQAIVPPIVASGSATPFSGFGSHTKGMAPAKEAFVATATDFSKPCRKKMKKCKKDEDNCKHVLDILQFLRLRNIAVEKKAQREADARNWAGPKRSNLMSLHSVLKKKGLELPKSEDWDWAGTNSSHKLFIQSVLEEDGLAILDHPWSPVPPVGMMVHELPMLPSPSHVELPSSAMPVTLQNIRHHGSPKCQKDLDICHKEIADCKVSVDDHNSILNSIAGRAVQESDAKLNAYIAR